MSFDGVIVIPISTITRVALTAVAAYGVQILRKAPHGRVRLREIASWTHRAIVFVSACLYCLHCAVNSDRLCVSCASRETSSLTRGGCPALSKGDSCAPPPPPGLANTMSPRDSRTGRASRLEAAARCPPPTSLFVSDSSHTQEGNVPVCCGRILDCKN
jgi:hypothetical protein